MALDIGSELTQFPTQLKVMFTHTHTHTHTHTRFVNTNFSFQVLGWMPILSGRLPLDNVQAYLYYLMKLYIYFKL